jgi:cell division protease FtsH
MILDWGMSDKFRQIAHGGQRQQVFLGEEIAHRREYSETTAHEVDQEVGKILSDAYDQARDVLKEHRDGLDELVELLLEQEELSGQKVRDLLNGNKGH